MTKQTSTPRTAVLHRMVMPEHVCPSGLRALDLLKRRGFAINDQILTTRQDVEEFKQRHGVATTPQIWIDGQHVGGYEDLRRHLGMPIRDPNATSYVPVLAVFAAAAALAMAASQAVLGSAFTMRSAEWFVSFTMVLLAMLKLQDLDRFATMFLGYDLLAQRWVPYAWLYPFLEFGAGVLMSANILHGISIPVALFIGTIGTVSVFYAVYVQKRELKCACVGGSGRVPLGFVSLSENLAMLAMAGWMLAGPM